MKVRRLGAIHRGTNCMGRRGRETMRDMLDSITPLANSNNFLMLKMNLNTMCV